VGVFVVELFLLEIEFEVLVWIVNTSSVNI
jgi:hypothetical protein